MMFKFNIAISWKKLIFSLIQFKSTIPAGNIFYTALCEILCVMDNNQLHATELCTP